MSQTPPTKANSAQRKPRLSLAIATAFGLGYLPLAPGTWGSLAALPIYFFLYAHFYFGFYSADFVPDADHYTLRALCATATAVAISVFIAVIGVWASGRAAKFSGKKDPQFVVIDEVSGQHLTLLLGSVLPFRWSLWQTPWSKHQFDLGVPHSVLSWKFLLAGFILFRVFDIWKPFPARQAESLPGGWGIMADDWIAAIYAALGLWALRAAGL
jgi:phosphatidylglycerophosphatase A